MKKCWRSAGGTDSSGSEIPEGGSASPAVPRPLAAPLAASSSEIPEAVAAAREHLTRLPASPATPSQPSPQCPFLLPTVPRPPTSSTPPPAGGTEAHTGEHSRTPSRRGAAALPVPAWKPAPAAPTGIAQPAAPSGIARAAGQVCARVQRGTLPAGPSRRRLASARVRAEYQAIKSVSLWGCVCCAGRGDGPASPAPPFAAPTAPPAAAPISPAPRPTP
eukprot:scaffold16367_cov124-Isochrysis_galbana.AAC.6